MRRFTRSCNLQLRISSSRGYLARGGKEKKEKVLTELERFMRDGELLGRLSGLYQFDRFAVLPSLVVAVEKRWETLITTRINSAGD